MIKKIIIIVVLCKTCNVLLCILEQSRVDNSSGGGALSTGSNWSNWLKACPGYRLFLFQLITILETAFVMIWGTTLYVYYLAKVKRKLNVCPYFTYSMVTNQTSFKYELENLVYFADFTKGAINKQVMLTRPENQGPMREGFSRYIGPGPGEPRRDP